MSSIHLPLWQNLTEESVTIPLPRSRLTGCSCRSPVAHFYIHHAGSSIRELHPFTTITHLASKNTATPPTDNDFMIQFLFRKKSSQTAAPEKAHRKYLQLISRLLRGKSQRVKSTQWTERLAGLVDQQQPTTLPSTSPNPANPPPRIPISLRLEGPYFAPADPSRYANVICLVAGTGISGAIAIATAFRERHRSPAGPLTAEKPLSPLATDPPPCPWRTCLVVWSVQSALHVPLPFFEPSCEGLELRTCLTGPGRHRVDMRQVLLDWRERDRHGRSWVYISGPKAYIRAAEEACREVGGVDVFAASWDI